MSALFTLSPLQELAAKWRVIGLVAVAFARLMRRYEDGRAYGARAQAQQLYIAVRAAQVILAQEVAETLEAHPPQSRTDEGALTYLRRIAVCLLVISLAIQSIMARGELLGPAIWQIGEYEIVAMIAGFHAPPRRVPILDPG